jgi:uncharacterized membrane protein YqjE
MGSNELFVICGIAFIFVFVILAVLALSMRLIIIIFPEKKFGTDAAVVAVLASAVQKVFPGTQITKIEEKL